MTFKAFCRAEAALLTGLLVALLAFFVATGWAWRAEDRAGAAVALATQAIRERDAAREAAAIMRDLYGLPAGATLVALEYDAVVGVVLP